jgi:hypothetical protein
MCENTSHQPYGYPPLMAMNIQKSIINVAVRNTFVSIVQDFGFHVGQEQLHVFISNTFNSSCQ